MSSSVKIASSWHALLQGEFEQPYFGQLIDFVKARYKAARVYPPGRLIFRSFDLCSFEEVKVVLLGQDPYHGPGQAHGLCFSVPDGVRMPPSLVNIFKEIQRDVGKPFPKTGNLERWASQGVLLLNSILTVEARKAGAHQNRGWERFTDRVIEHIAQKKEGVVFMLWGAYAQKKGAFIDGQKHCVLSSPHPSPFSADRGFFGNSHFSRANEYLVERGHSPIDW